MPSINLPEYTEVLPDTQTADEMEPRDARQDEPQTEHKMPVATLPPMPTAPVSPFASHTRPRRNTKPSKMYSPDDYDLAQ